jgi:hypothetical protein
MSPKGYRWRQLSQNQRKELLEWRKMSSVAFTSAPAKPWTSAISHFGGLL